MKSFKTKKTRLVILAGGFGYVGSPEKRLPKVLIELKGKTILRRIIDMAERAGFYRPIIIGQALYHEEFINKLGQHGHKYDYAEQSGKGGAVKALMESFQFLGNDDDAVILFGDMPNWSDKTIRDAVHSHQNREGTDITVGVINLRTMKKNELRRKYDRWTRVDIKNGRVYEMILPYHATRGDKRSFPCVSPSLYVAKVTALKRYAPIAIPDGPKLESTLPHLVNAAIDCGAMAISYVINNPYEAMAVDKLEDLILVKRLMPG